MDFIKKKVKQYNEKKLGEASSKLKFHSDMKKQWEQKVKEMHEESIKGARDKVIFHGKMIDVWKNNIEKIRSELNKLDM